MDKLEVNSDGRRRSGGNYSGLVVRRLSVNFHAAKPSLAGRNKSLEGSRTALCVLAKHAATVTKDLETCRLELRVRFSHEATSAANASVVCR